jgi:hypothetical protein
MLLSRSSYLSTSLLTDNLPIPTTSSVQPKIFVNSEVFQNNLVSQPDTIKFRVDKIKTSFLQVKIRGNQNQ